MSHDPSPSVYDPIVVPDHALLPDASCRSPSTGTVARPRARWTALSLAAAVVLWGTRALADDEVRVHIDSPVPATLAVDSGYKKWRIRPPRGGGLGQDRRVCDSPCDDAVNPGLYVITGSFPKSPLFSLADRKGDVTISVRPGSYGRRTAGFYALLFSPLGVVAPGVPMLIIGGAAGDKTLSGAGIAFMVAGGVTAIVGGALIATSGTRVDLRSTGVGPAGSAARVKPRYWMGEF